MRCKSCNRPIEEWVPAYYQPEDSPEPIEEDLCAGCLFIVRADLYDGGPPDAVDNLTHLVGNFWEDAPNGG